MARVLVVDDSKMVRILVRAMLEELGHECIGEASDGLEGYEKYFELKPDLMLVDITMPVMDGVTTVKRIMQKDADAKIILLTSNTNTEKVKEAVEAGVAEILFKPVDEGQLEETMRQILNKEERNGIS